MQDSSFGVGQNNMYSAMRIFHSVLLATAVTMQHLAIIHAPNGDSAFVDMTDPTKIVLVGVHHRGGTWSHSKDETTWAGWKKKHQ